MQNAPSLMQFKLYSSLMQSAQCNPVQAAACTLLDKGMTFKEVASYLKISVNVVSNIYDSKAELFAAEKRKFETTLSEVAAEIRSQTTNELEAREAELKHPTMRRLKQFVWVCLNHYGAATKHWPSLTFNQYALVRTLAFFKTINHNILAPISGVNKKQVEPFLDELMSIGVLTKLAKASSPYAHQGKLYNSKTYDTQLHRFFTNIEYRDI